MTLVRDVLLIIVLTAIIVFMIKQMYMAKLAPKTSCEVDDIFKYILDSKRVCANYTLSTDKLICSTSNYIWVVDCKNGCNQSIYPTAKNAEI